MSSSSPQVNTFVDSLETRAKQLRFRQIGSPYAFLNSVGINPILEEIYKGANIVDVAKKLNISIGVFLTWIENEGYFQKVEDATKFSAEGYLSEASTLLREANTEFQLKKAKEIASHGRFMASKLDKTKYGGDNTKLGNATGVTFIMHMGQQGDRVVHAALSSEPRDRPIELLNVNGTFGIVPVAKPTPTLAVEPEEIGPFEPEPFIPEENAVPLYLRDADIVHEEEA